MAIDDPLLAPLKTVLDPATVRKLATLELHTIDDLIRHYPRNYIDIRQLTDLALLPLGEQVSVVLDVVSAQVRQNRSRAGSRLEVTASDGHRTIAIVFFFQRRGPLRWHEDALKPGTRALFTGKLGDHGGRPQLLQPKYEVIGRELADDAEAEERANYLQVVYPATSKAKTDLIAQAVKTVLDPLTITEVPNVIPDEIRQEFGLQGSLEALRNVHRPTEMDHVNAAKDTLRWEEAFVLQTTLAQRRAQAQKQRAIIRAAVDEGIRADFEAALPFELTAGQKAVGEEIAQDLQREHPMQRLLQGEVGSGKTIVALRAMLQVIDAGGQAALLAPTEVLAAQHAQSLRKMLGPLAEGGMLGGAAHGTQITLLTGSLPTADRREALLKAASGEAGIVVGTHALLSENVSFADLGLVVVDEQHRFGVEQRDALRAKGVGDSIPHLLVMTATPIPRTVAMTVFGDLEISTLRELPRGRAGIQSHLVPASKPHWVDRIWQRVREEVEAGARAYIVCSRIGEAGDSGAANQPGDEVEVSADEGETQPTSVLDLAEELKDHPEFAQIDIEVLHGRLAPDVKDRAMARFVSGEAPVLISTTVIEVGVDVPAATVMVIMDADRFGVSQLHQLRGRVGRGSKPGLCLLVTTADPASETGERLARIAATHDGFELAQLDLEVRREGDVLGTAQSGRTSLRLLRATVDVETIAQARNAANALIETDPDLAQHPALESAIRRVDPERAEFLDRT